MIFQS